jgi:hypothetical protein
MQDAGMWECFPCNSAHLVDDGCSLGGTCIVTLVRVHESREAQVVNAHL